MRNRLAHWIYPDMCTASRGIVQSYRGSDTYNAETGEITPGVTVTQHRSCGKRAGHHGEHGPWGRWFYWRWRVAEFVGGKE